jgi:long-chain acyl-CoA synthetase
MNNPLYTERELTHQLADSDATVLVTLDLLLPRALKIKAETSIRSIVTCHINDYLPFPKKQLFPLVKKGMYRKVEPQSDVYEFMISWNSTPDAPVENKADWSAGRAYYTEELPCQQGGDAHARKISSRGAGVFRVVPRP